MRSVAICASLLVSVFLISFTHVPFVLASESPFSVVWITDTQYLSQSHPNDFDRTCNWIVDNSGTYNVQMVVHTGDIVDNALNPVEWMNANHSMGILLDHGIPYCWDAGNHDDLYNWSGKYYTAFNSTLMSRKPYWISSYSEGRNTAVQFKIGNWSFIVVNIEFRGDDSVLGWANSVLNKYPDSYAIVATHAYLREDCKYDAWATHFQDVVLNNHTNVFMTLSGHYHATTGVNRTLVGKRNELFFDYQDLDKGEGGATARILTFDMAEGTIHVTTYKPYAAQFVSDSNNQFTLNIPSVVPEYSPSIVLLIMVLLPFFYIRMRKSQRRAIIENSSV